MGPALGLGFSLCCAALCWDLRCLPVPLLEYADGLKSALNAKPLACLTPPPSWPQHELVVARAVAELRLLAELCLPLAAPGGHWVAAKGPAPQASPAAAPLFLAL